MSIEDLEICSWGTAGQKAGGTVLAWVTRATGSPRQVAPMSGFTDARSCFRVWADMDSWQSNVDLRRDMRTYHSMCVDDGLPKLKKDMRHLLLTQEVCGGGW